MNNKYKELVQGQIIKVGLNPVAGHEQRGDFRPALIVSSNLYNQMCGGMIKICPISNTDHEFPLHIPLDDEEQKKQLRITGSVLIQQERSLDLSYRDFKLIEKVDDDYCNKIIAILKHTY